jgi:hypothetical protein
MLAALSRKHIACGPVWGGPALGPHEKTGHEGRLCAVRVALT